jgi:hypothetical protein
MGRYLALTVLAVVLTSCVYFKIRAAAIAEVEAAATADALRRVGRAVTAGDAVDTSPERVRESDGHRRD